MNTLDFSQLPDINITSAYFKLGEEIESPLSNFTNVLERANNAIKFLSLMNRESNDLHFQNDFESLGFRQGLLRAALMEFNGIEDMLKTDLAFNNNREKIILIRNLSHPLLHIIHELRNLHIHLISNNISKDIKKNVLWGNVKDLSNAMKLDLTIWMIDDIKEDDFYKLKNSKYFEKTDIIKLIDWFNRAQKVWGVSDLVQRAVIIYCKEIISNYRLNIKIA
jgi:hypothetical protein